MNACEENLTNRQTGIDLLKVMAMLLITATHFVSYSGILDNEALLPVNRVLFSGIFIFSRSALNLFAMITGFVMVKKRFSVRRIFRLWFDVAFISLVGLLIAVVFLDFPGTGVLLKSIFPISTFSYWYMNTHIMLLCISPLINIFIDKTDAKFHFRVCSLLTMVLSIVFAMNPFANSQVYIGHGHGIVWFSVLYLWGGYFARKTQVVSKFVTAAVGVTAFAFLLAADLLQDQLMILSAFNLFEMNSFFMIILALSVFVILKDVLIKGWMRKTIGVLAEASLFVYLIQEHNALRTAFWSLFRITDFVDTHCIWVVFLFAVMCLWPIALVTKKVTSLIWPCFEKGFLKLEEYLCLKSKLIGG